MKYVLVSYAPISMATADVERLPNGAYLVVSDEPYAYVELFDGEVRRVSLSPCDDKCIEEVRVGALRAFLKGGEDPAGGNSPSPSRKAARLVVEALLSGYAEAEADSLEEAYIMAQKLKTVGVVQAGVVKVEVDGIVIRAYRAR